MFYVLISVLSILFIVFVFIAARQKHRKKLFGIVCLLLILANVVFCFLPQITFLPRINKNILDEIYADCMKDVDGKTSFDFDNEYFNGTVEVYDSEHNPKFDICFSGKSGETENLQYFNFYATVTKGKTHKFGAAAMRELYLFGYDGGLVYIKYKYTPDFYISILNDYILPCDLFSPEFVIK